MPSLTFSVAFAGAVFALRPEFGIRTPRGQGGRKMNDVVDAGHGRVRAEMREKV
jgi:hypothetical protein